MGYTMSSRSGRRKLKMPGLNQKQFKIVNKLVNKDIPVKNYSNTFTGSIGTTATYVDVTAHASENSETIRVYRVEVHFGLERNATTAQLVRVVIGRWRQEGVISSGITMTSIPTTTNAFIYYDRVFALTTAQTEPIQQKVVMKFRKGKIPHLNIKYDSSNNSASNGIFLAYISTENTNKANIYGFRSIKYVQDEKSTA